MAVSAEVRDAAGGSSMTVSNSLESFFAKEGSAGGTVQRNAAGSLVVDSPQVEGCPSSLFFSRPPKIEDPPQEEWGTEGVDCEALDSRLRGNDRLVESGG